MAYSDSEAQLLRENRALKKRVASLEKALTLRLRELGYLPDVELQKLAGGSRPFLSVVGESQPKRKFNRRSPHA